MTAVDAAIAGTHPHKRPAYTYVHTVSFEETNLMGNVYFARHIAWQGRCREMFLKDHAPEVLRELSGDLRLLTLKTSCEYFEELRALDTVEVLMRLVGLRQNRIELDFEYQRLDSRGRVVVAVGFQELLCMKAEGECLTPVAPPSSLKRALRPYGADNP